MLKCLIKRLNIFIRHWRKKAAIYSWFCWLVSASYFFFICCTSKIRFTNNNSNKYQRAVGGVWLLLGKTFFFFHRIDNSEFLRHFISLQWIFHSWLFCFTFLRFSQVLEIFWCLFADVIYKWARKRKLYDF